METDIKVKIYVLVDPITCKVRYIGRTIVSLPMRLSQHIHRAKLSNTHLHNWIKSLLKINSKPRIRQISSIIGWKESHKFEQALIHKYSKRLLNHNDRGEGGLNSIITKEQREAISKTLAQGYRDGSIEHPRNKMLYVYDIAGKFVDVYPSTKWAAEVLEVGYSSIKKCLTGECKQNSGYQYSREFKEMPDLSEHRVGNYRRDNDYAPYREFRRLKQ